MKIDTNLDYDNENMAIVIILDVVCSMYLF